MSEIKFKQYSSEKLQQALEATLSGCSINAAARYHRIPVSTLRLRKIEVLKQQKQAKESAQSSKRSLAEPEEAENGTTMLPKKKRVRRKSTQPYSPRSFRRALKAALSGISIYKAARIYNVPVSTLRIRKIAVEKGDMKLSTACGDEVDSDDDNDSPDDLNRRLLEDSRKFRQRSVSKKLRQYSPERLASALEKTLTGTPVLTAARMFDLPESTLRIRKIEALIKLEERGVESCVLEADPLKYEPGQEYEHRDDGNRLDEGADLMLEEDDQRSWDGSPMHDGEYSSTQERDLLSCCACSTTDDSLQPISSENLDFLKVSLNKTLFISLDDYNLYICPTCDQAIGFVRAFFKKCTNSLTALSASVKSRVEQSVSASFSKQQTNPKIKLESEIDITPNEDFDSILNFEMNLKEEGALLDTLEGDGISKDDVELKDLEAPLEKEGLFLPKKKPTDQDLKWVLRQFTERKPARARQLPFQTEVYTCDLCQSIFDKKRRLVKHMRAQHVSHNTLNPNGNFECDVCHKVYKSESGLTVHQRLVW